MLELLQSRVRTALSSAASQVCFEGLGCFADGPPWGGTDHRPVSALPSHPDEIGTRFLLFTQRNRYYQARSMLVSVWSNIPTGAVVQIRVKLGLGLGVRVSLGVRQG